MKKISSSLLVQIRIIAAICMLQFLASCSVMLPVSANSNAVGGSKTGTATAVGILGFYPNRDASIQKAAKNGGISRVSTVNVKVSNYFWIVTTYETSVTGD